jgi:hypothetical protein
VRGTPGCGKTIVLYLLHHYIRQFYPEAFIRYYNNWPQNPTGSLDHRLLKMDPRYPRQQITFLLLDDAQDSYSDVDLWNVFLKSVQGTYTKYRVVLFSSYGSHSGGNALARGTPPVLHRAASFDLWNTYNSPGLLLNRQELDDVVNRYDPLCKKFSELLRDRIYTWTAGHAGAVADLLGFILNVSV